MSPLDDRPLEESQVLDLAKSLFSTTSFKVIPYLLDTLRNDAIAQVEDGDASGVEMLQCLATVRGAFNTMAAACGRDAVV